MGAEKRPTRENVLCRPQHQDDYLGKTTAATARVRVSPLSYVVVTLGVFSLFKSNMNTISTQGQTETTVPNELQSSAFTL